MIFLLYKMNLKEKQEEIMKKRKCEKKEKDKKAKSDKSGRKMERKK